ncbi:MAG: hypothetical protein QNJ38_05790 [Prochloraceae cyanobacterium]|nr:hypothetical protein [Prochloraceae cyanobacterium]
MQLTDQKYYQKNLLLTSIKSFAIWTFTLTVCFLVVGFPLGFVLSSIGVLITIVLHTIMPASSVLLVGTIFLILNALSVLVGAAILTIKRVDPQDVTWLSWLHGDAEPHYTRVYASCPLTCSLPE